MSRGVAKTLVMLTVVVFCAPLWAQFSSSIDGRVVDATQAIVPGITLTLENPTTGVALTTKTSENGYFLSRRAVRPHTVDNSRSQSQLRRQHGKETVW